MTASAEIELLLCAAGKSVSPAPLRELCARADWNLLMEAAEFHGLTALLAQAAANAAPEQAARRLHAAYVESVRRSLFFIAELQQLLASFEARNVPVISLKGPALGSMLYGDPALRPCSDLDFLVEPARAADAIAVLAREGFHLASHLAALPLGTLLRFECETRLRGQNIDVDLQWATAPAGHALSFSPQLLWRERALTPLGEGLAPGLNREAVLIYLCAHGAKHGWSRLIWLADIARLAEGPLDWDRATALAAEARCEKPLLLGIALAHRLLATEFPKMLLTRAVEDASVQALAERAGTRLSSLPPVEPESLALISFSGALANGLEDKLGHYSTLILSPTEAEFQAISLPGKLFFLYYPLRITRLAAKYLGRFFSWP